MDIFLPKFTGRYFYQKQKKSFAVIFFADNC